MNWNEITIEQFQQIAKIRERVNAPLDEIGRLDCTANLLAILYKKTLADVEGWAFSEFTLKAKGCKFILVDEVPTKPVRSFKIDGKTYRINYRMQDFKVWQLKELITLTADPIQRLHYIMAAITTRTKWGFRKKVNNGYESRANVMLKAPIAAACYAFSFYKKLYVNTFKEVRPMLINEMVAKGFDRSVAASNVDKIYHAINEELNY